MHTAYDIESALSAAQACIMKNGWTARVVAILPQDGPTNSTYQTWSVVLYRADATFGESRPFSTHLLAMDDEASPGFFRGTYDLTAAGAREWLKDRAEEAAHGLQALADTDILA